MSADKMSAGLTAQGRWRAGVAEDLLHEGALEGRGGYLACFARGSRAGRDEGRCGSVSVEFQRETSLVGV